MGLCVGEEDGGGGNTPKIKIKVKNRKFGEIVSVVSVFARI